MGRQEYQIHKIIDMTLSILCLTQVIGHNKARTELEQRHLRERKKKGKSPSPSPASNRYILEKRGSQALNLK